MSSICAGLAALVPCERYYDLRKNLPCCLKTWCWQIEGEGEGVAEMERDFLKSLRGVRTLDVELQASMDQVLHDSGL